MGKKKVEKSDLPISAETLVNQTPELSKHDLFVLNKKYKGQQMLKEEWILTLINEGYHHLKPLLK